MTPVNQINQAVSAMRGITQAFAKADIRLVMGGIKALDMILPGLREEAAKQGSVVEHAVNMVEEARVCFMAAALQLDSHRKALTFVGNHVRGIEIGPVLVDSDGKQRLRWTFDLVDTRSPVVFAVEVREDGKGTADDLIQIAHEANQDWIGMLRDAQAADEGKGE